MARDINIKAAVTELQDTKFQLKELTMRKETIEHDIARELVEREDYVMLSVNWRKLATAIQKGYYD